MSRYHTIIALTVSAMLLVACESTGSSKSGFLQDYSGLQPHPEIAGASLYLKDETILRGYDKVMLDPVTIVYAPHAGNRGISPYVLKELTDYFHASMVRALSDAYPIVEQPGEGVLRIRTAITGVRPLSKPTEFRGTPATYVQAKLRNAAADYFSDVETAMEAELLDSQTSERIAAFTDRRVGGAAKPPEGAPAWDQVAGALDFWADRLRLGLDRSRNKQ